jgi:hypothetical protein
MEIEARRVFDMVSPFHVETMNEERNTFCLKGIYNIPQSFAKYNPGENSPGGAAIFKLLGRPEGV